MLKTSMRMQGQAEAIEALQLQAQHKVEELALLGQQLAAKTTECEVFGSGSLVCCCLIK